MATLTLARFAGVALPPPYGAFVRAVHALLAWQERARSRRQLAGLDDRLLRDIGLDRATASRELDKGFWQT